jgi:hypothetical protein
MSPFGGTKQVSKQAQKEFVHEVFMIGAILFAITILIFMSNNFTIK